MNTSTERLMRSRSEKIIGGVAGGIAQYLAVDPVLVRLAFVALALGGIGLLAYPILWLIMPLDGSSVTASYRSGEMNQQAARVNQEVREVFVTTASGTRRARFDPMTGQPFDEGDEIPINNVDGSGLGTAPQAQRNRWLGIALVGFGLFVAVNMIAPGLGRFLVPALLIAGGVMLLRRLR